MAKKVKLKLKSAIKNSILKAPDIMLSKVTEPLNKDNYQRIVNSFLKVFISPLKIIISCCNKLSVLSSAFNWPVYETPDFFSTASNLET